MLPMNQRVNIVVVLKTQNVCLGHSGRAHGALHGLWKTRQTTRECWNVVLLVGSERVKVRNLLKPHQKNFVFPKPLKVQQKIEKPTKSALFSLKYSSYTVFVSQCVHHLCIISIVFKHIMPCRTIVPKQPLKSSRLRDMKTIKKQESSESLSEFIQNSQSEVNRSNLGDSASDQQTTHNTFYPSSTWQNPLPPRVVSLSLNHPPPL